MPNPHIEEAKPAEWLETFYETWPIDNRPQVREHRAVLSLIGFFMAIPSQIASTPEASRKNQPKRSKRKYFIYLRAGRENVAHSAPSLMDQEEKLSGLFGHLSIVETITEIGSAGARKRPVFDSMMERIESGEADGLIAYRPDRLARRAPDVGRIVSALQRGKLRDLQFPDDSFEHLQNLASTDWRVVLVHRVFGFGPDDRSLWSDHPSR